MMTSWVVDVKDNLITVQRGAWSPQPMSVAQARKIIEGLDKAIRFLDGETFTPYRIGV